MTIGAYNRRVRLRRRTQTVVAGRSTTTYVEAFPGAPGFPARIEPLSTREFLGSAQGQGRVSTRITLQGVRSEQVEQTMQVVDDRGHAYSIEGPPLEDPRTGREYVTLMCMLGGEGAK